MISKSSVFGVKLGHAILCSSASGGTMGKDYADLPIYSGATCFAATDRTASAATAADCCNTPTICEYGDDSPTTANAAGCKLSRAASQSRPDVYGGHVTSCQRLSIPTTNATATTIRRTSKCPNATIVTPSKPIGTSKHEHGTTTSSVVRGCGFYFHGLQPEFRGPESRKCVPTWKSRWRTSRGRPSATALACFTGG